jgi:choloylglycine hydrolase
MRTSFSPDIVWTHLDHVDFDRAARLDPTADNLVGDVTGRYEPREPFAFVLVGS